jgi:hypothetical protein
MGQGGIVGELFTSKETIKKQKNNTPHSLDAESTF